MAVRLLGLARARFWVVTCFGLTGLALASRGHGAARYVFASGSFESFLQGAQRFASSAGHLGQSSSTRSRRGGDDCTAAACEVVLVLTGGWSLAGHRQLVRHREPGIL